MEDFYVNLARKALESFVIEKQVIDVPNQTPIEMLEKRAGTFVSLKINGMLRGCIGTISPLQKNIALEIIENAISAGSKDPRFEPVRADELSLITYSVDVLMEPEVIEDIAELDVKKYGVIVSHGYRRGLLLPDLIGISTAEEQVLMSLKKAGIGPYEDFKMERFEVIRHGSL